MNTLYIIILRYEYWWKEMYSNILLAVDGSEQNKTAVRGAIALAKALGSKVTAVYVMVGVDLKPNAFGGDVGAEERKEIAENASKDSFDLVISLAQAEGVELETLALPGKPCDVLVEMSDKYDLLICGSLGRTGLTKLMGSVS